MSRHQPQRFYRVELINPNGKPQHFYVWAPTQELAEHEAVRWTGGDVVTTDDCTPRRRAAA